MPRKNRTKNPVTGKREKIPYIINTRTGKPAGPEVSATPSLPSQSKADSGPVTTTLLDQSGNAFQLETPDQATNDAMLTDLNASIKGPTFKPVNDSVCKPIKTVLYSSGQGACNNQDVRPTPTAIPASVNGSYSVLAQQLQPLPGSTSASVVMCAPANPNATGSANALAAATFALCNMASKSDNKALAFGGIILLFSVGLCVMYKGRSQQGCPTLKWPSCPTLSWPSWCKRRRAGYSEVASGPSRSVDMDDHKDARGLAAQEHGVHGRYDGGGAQTNQLPPLTPLQS